MWKYLVCTEKVGAQGPGTELLGPLGALSVGRENEDMRSLWSPDPKQQVGWAGMGQTCPWCPVEKHMGPFPAVPCGFKTNAWPCDPGSVSLRSPRPDASVSPGQLPQKDSLLHPAHQ